MADNIQTQAMERLKQMYSKAQTDERRTTNPSPLQKIEEPSKKEPETEDVQRSKKQDSIADLFLKDKEKSLILLLIVILISEKADTSVVLALLYLIL